jgi:glutamate 5-kinase
MIVKLINDARKIIIKLGSNTLANSEGKINTELLSEFSQQVAALMRSGKQIVIVSSGAQVAGLSTMGKWARKKDLHYRQALCAVGQVELMDAWRRVFSQHDFHVAQILLTRDDFNDSNRT